MVLVKKVRVVTASMEQYIDPWFYLARWAGRSVIASQKYRVMGASKNKGTPKWMGL